MPTVAELNRDGAIHRYDPELPANRQEDRCLYASTRLKDWIEKPLPTLGSSWDIDTSPLEQFDSFISDFAAGEPLVFRRQFSALRPIGNGVWELKTADLRIFGWFANKDCFIGVVADHAQRVKDHGLYAGYRDEVVRFRNELQLDEPKFVPGEDPNAVISNFNYP
jgi:hypothetical protein